MANSKVTKEIRQLQDALQNKRSSGNPDDADVLAAISELARAYRRAGLLAEAKELLEELLLIRSQIADADNYFTLKAETQLSLVLYDMGDFETSQVMQTRILRVLQQKYEGEDEAILQAKVNLANSMSTAGNLQEALVLDREIVQDRELINGPNHVETMRSRSQLARTLRSLGDAEAAKNIEREMLRSSASRLFKRNRGS
jgi:tetratricopeptide (TPR) repeat protein